MFDVVGGILKMGMTSFPTLCFHFRSDIFQACVWHRTCAEIFANIIFFYEQELSRMINGGPFVGNDALFLVEFHSIIIIFYNIIYVVLGCIYLKFPLKFPLSIKWEFFYEKWEFSKKEFPLLLNRKWEL